MAYFFFKVTCIKFQPHLPQIRSHKEKYRDLISDPLWSLEKIDNMPLLFICSQQKNHIYKNQT